MTFLQRTDGTMLADDVELAKGLFKMSMGLMFRKSIGQNYAMIFDLHHEQYIGIHMLFVPFYIDLIYLDQEKRVIDIKHQLRPWIGIAYPKKPARYAIELKSGTAARLELKDGDLLEW
jgi:Uncharacterized conserved protein